MKINVTYEAGDIERLVRQDLTRQGLDASSASITFENNEAHVVISGVVPEEPEPASEPAPTPPPTLPAPATPTTLAVVDGGNNPVDMTDVLGASAKVAANKPPLYPKGERQLMEGESTEFPGVPRR